MDSFICHGILGSNLNPFAISGNKFEGVPGFPGFTQFTGNGTPLPISLNGSQAGYFSNGVKSWNFNFNIISPFYGTFKGNVLNLTNSFTTANNQYEVLFNDYSNIVLTGLIGTVLKKEVNGTGFIKYDLTFSVDLNSALYQSGEEFFPVAVMTINSNGIQAITSLSGSAYNGSKYEVGDFFLFDNRKFKMYSGAALHGLAQSAFSITPNTYWT